MAKPLHYLRQPRFALAAQRFSRGDEAYLFLGAGHTGYRFGYLEYPLARIMEYFNAPPSAEHRRGSLLVIHITPSAVERHIVNDRDDNATGPGFMTPFEDGFYAMCSGAVLCKWTAHGFEPATVEEQRRLDGGNRLVRGSMNNQIVNPKFHEVPESTLLILRGIAKSSPGSY